MGSGGGSMRSLDRCCWGLRIASETVWQDGSWESTFAAPTQLPMYSVIWLFEIRSLINAGNLTVAMVHHSGSIQSFKQQKGWSPMWLFRLPLGVTFPLKLDSLRCAVGLRVGFADRFWTPCPLIFYPLLCVTLTVLPKSLSFAAGYSDPADQIVHTTNRNHAILTLLLCNFMTVWCCSYRRHDLCTQFN